MPDQNQDVFVKLAENFKRYEQHLAYFLCADKPDSTFAIDDRDLELPISFRLAQIGEDRYALSTFVNKHWAEYSKHARRLADEPESGLHAFYTARHCFAVRKGQRALGQSAEELLPWPEPLQRLFAQVHHSDLLRCLEEDMALAPSRYTELILDPDRVVSRGKHEIFKGRQSGQVTSPKITPPLRNREKAIAANLQRFDSTSEHIASYVSVNRDQSRPYSVSPRIPLNGRRMKNVLTPIVGDKPYTLFRDYLSLVQNSRSMQLKRSDEGTREYTEQYETYASTDELMREALTFAESSVIRLTATALKTSALKPPMSEEDISQWYYSLGDYEQCYVHIAAIFPGISAHEISMEADVLYHSLYERAEKRETTLRIVSQQGEQKETHYAETRCFKNPLIARVPKSILFSSLGYTCICKEMEVEHIYWDDTDQHGMSTLRINLLAFLTKEFMLKGEQGPKFMHDLYNWSQNTENRERSLKAAYAYGVVLRCYEPQLLSMRANEWAQVRSHHSWLRTSELLNGAFAFESIQNDETPSVVLRILDSWIAQVHQGISQQRPAMIQKNITRLTNARVQEDETMLSQATNLAWMVAFTYALIGKRRPDIALNGLQRLLQLPQIESTNYTRSIYVAVVSTYVHLARSGGVCDVLEYLAENAESYSTWRKYPHKLDERRVYRLHRQVSLHAFLDAFFLIAAESYFERRETFPESSISQSPFLTTDGRDMISAGLLSQSDEELREHITTLLCATIMEKKSRLAFSLLRTWTEVARETPDKQALIQCIVDLGKRVETWCRLLEERGLCPPRPIEAFKCRVAQWNEEGRFPPIP